MITDKDIDQLMLQNQAGFDKLPSARAWQQIGSALENEEIKVQSNQLRKWLMIASVLLFVTFGYLFNAKILKTNYLANRNNYNPNPDNELLLIAESKEEKNPIKDIIPNETVISNDKIYEMVEEMAKPITPVKETNVKKKTEAAIKKEIPKEEFLATAKIIQKKADTQLLKDKKEDFLVLNEEEMANVEEIVEVNEDYKFARSTKLSKATEDFQSFETKEGFTGISSSKSGNRKEKIASTKGKSAHIIEYYKGIWETKSALEKGTSVKFSDKITLVFDEDEKVYIYGIDKQTIPLHISQISELHLLMTSQKGQQIKISYLSNKEALLLYTDENGKASVVLKKN